MIADIISRILALIISLSLLWGSIQCLSTGRFGAGVTGVLMLILAVFVLFISFGSHETEQFNHHDWDD